MQLTRKERRALVELQQRIVTESASTKPDILEMSLDGSINRRDCPHSAEDRRSPLHCLVRVIEIWPSDDPRATGDDFPGSLAETSGWKAAI